MKNWALNYIIQRLNNMEISSHLESSLRQKNLKGLACCFYDLGQDYRQQTLDFLSHHRVERYLEAGDMEFLVEILCSDEVKFRTPEMVYMEGNGSDIKPFYIADVPVSGIEFLQTMPSDTQYDGCLSIAEVSFIDAVIFCNNKSLKEGLWPAYRLPNIDFLTDEVALRKVIGDNSYNPSFWTNNLVLNKASNGYRLPTEAEWRFAANGGREYKDGYTFRYSGSDNLDEVAKIRSSYPPPDVRKFKGNEKNLYGFSGSVWQHVWNFKDDKALRLGGSYMSEYSDVCRLDYPGCRSDLLKNKAGIRLVLPCGKNQEE